MSDNNDNDNENDNDNDNVELDNFIEALENDNNSTIMKLTSDKIVEHKNSILDELNLEKKKKDEFLEKLEDYRYCSEMSDLEYGSYIRWIPLTNPDRIFITKGANIIDIKIMNDGILLICKSIDNRYFKIKFDNCIIFQKISLQENIILNVLDYLEK